MECITCSRCKASKPTVHFGRSSRNKSGHQSWCKGCVNTHKREWEKKNAARKRAYQREWWLRRRYGIGVEEYDAMFAAQGGVCAVCGTDNPSGRSEHFHVDHDHETGAIRGLLCHNCNRGIGCLGDTADALRRALAYLEGVS